MNADRLVQMANQISQFFESQADREGAVAGVLDHLKRFWDPRMREAIVAHLAMDGEGLRDVARAAVERLGVDAPAART